MTWSPITWAEAGTWATTDTLARTGQSGGSADGVALPEVLGSITTRGAQTVNASEDATIYCDIELLQVGQAARAVGVETLLGDVGTEGASESASGLSDLAITAAASTGQAQSTFGSSDVAGLGYADKLADLLRYPHNAVFDKSPAKTPLFRLSYGDEGLSWRVADGNMHVTVDGFTRVYELAGKTVGDLLQLLAAAGVDVLVLDADRISLSATIILEAENQNENDAVYGFTSLLWALMQTYAVEVKHAAGQVVEALGQMVITQAEGEWLDLWGRLYAVGRAPGQSDDAYAPTIPTEAFRLRVNAHAIEKAIWDATGWDVRIEEPWREFFQLDASLLSGPEKFREGDSVGYFLIRPTTRDRVDWNVVLQVIERNRPAGVLVLGAVNSHPSFVDGTGATVQSALTSAHRSSLPYEDRVLLDYMAIEDVSLLNFGSIHRRNRIYPSITAAPDAYTVISNQRRTYRSHTLGAVLGGASWGTSSTWGRVTWRDLPPILSAHTRSS